MYHIHIGPELDSNNFDIENKIYTKSTQVYFDKRISSNYQVKLSGKNLEPKLV